MIRNLVFVLLISFSHVSFGMSGSSTFICELIQYSEDPAEIAEATAEAKKRGICGYEKPPRPEPTPEQRRFMNPSQKAEDAFFMLWGIHAIKNGKIQGPVTVQPVP